MRFSLPFEVIETGAVADTFKTLAGLIVPDTAGYRCRIRKLVVGFGDDAPSDRNVAIALRRVPDVGGGSDGSFTPVAVVNIPHADPESIDSLIPGGRNWTVEPNDYETEHLFVDDLNDRGGIVMEWDEEDAPKALRDMLIAVCGAPRTANASKITGTVEFELY